MNTTKVVATWTLNLGRLADEDSDGYTSWCLRTDDCSIHWETRQKDGVTTLVGLRVDCARGATRDFIRWVIVMIPVLELKERGAALLELKQELLDTYKL